MVATLADVVPLVALAVLLGVAIAHLRAGVEALVAVLCAGAVLATGVLGTGDVRRELDRLLPVVLFLVAILVVAECCRAAGLFSAIGARLARRGTATALFGWTFLVAVAVTVVLSLDATVVLLTPVALAAAGGTAASRPLQSRCVRLANSASLLLPVSNLTNLLALPHLDLSFGRFALLMAPPFLFTLAVEYAVHRVWFRADLGAPTRRTGVPAAPPPPPLPRTPLLVVVLMLAGFAIGSGFDLAPAWFAGAAAAVLGVRALVRAELRPRALAASTHLGFALFVLSLGLVVAGLVVGPFGDLVARLVPDHAGLAGLLGTALLGAVLANLLNNLPATLLLAPLAAPLGAVAVLAALIGINLGSSMTWPGSLANLLWRRTVTRSSGTVSSRDFHLVGLLAAPVATLGSVVLLWAWAGVV